MPTYAYSTQNRLRSPSGAVGEAPDGPGGVAALRDDVDNYLGNGGAETVATVAAMQAIPINRCFRGKLVYVTATDTVYRYLGANNVTPIISDAPSSAAWLAWSKPATSYTPAIQNLNWSAFSYRQAFWGLSEGLFWTQMQLSQSGTGTPTNNADIYLQPPSPVIGGFAQGRGHFNPAGGSNNGQQIPLHCYSVGPSGQSSSNIRIRPLVVAAAATSPVRENILGSVVTAGAAGDSLTFDVIGPTGSYA